MDRMGISRCCCTAPYDCSVYSDDFNRASVGADWSTSGDVFLTSNELELDWGAGAAVAHLVAAGRGTAYVHTTFTARVNDDRASLTVHPFATAIGSLGRSYEFSPRGRFQVVDSVGGTIVFQSQIDFTINQDITLAFCVAAATVTIFLDGQIIHVDDYTSASGVDHFTLRAVEEVDPYNTLPAIPPGGSAYDCFIDDFSQIDTFANDANCLPCASDAGPTQIKCPPCFDELILDLGSGGWTDYRCDECTEIRGEYSVRSKLETDDCCPAFFHSQIGNFAARCPWKLGQDLPGPAILRWPWYRNEVLGFGGALCQWVYWEQMPCTTIQTEPVRYLILSAAYGWQPVSTGGFFPQIDRSKADLYWAAYAGIWEGTACFDPDSPEPEPTLLTESLDRAYWISEFTRIDLDTISVEAACGELALPATLYKQRTSSGFGVPCCDHHDPFAKSCEGNLPSEITLSLP